MYAEAMTKTRTTGDAASLAKERTAIRDYLASLKNLKGLEGDISFDKDRESLKPVYVIEAKSGAWTLLDTRNPK